jgi:hypothetical protein
MCSDNTPAILQIYSIHHRLSIYHINEATVYSLGESILSPQFQWGILCRQHLVEPYLKDFLHGSLNRYFLLHYNPELEVKETTDTASSASFLDLYLEFDDSGQISTKIDDTSILKS